MSHEPIDVVRRYYRAIWTDHNVDLIPSLCADPVIRHDSRGDASLSHAEQQQRVMGHVDKQLRMQIISGHGDAQFATILWQLTSAVSDYRLSGIEVVRVIDGRIAEVWNTTRDLPWE